MNISPGEAEEALAAIEAVTRKTRHSFASGGATIFLIVTGIVWLVGFLATQFLTGAIVPAIWVGISLLGTGLSIYLGNRKKPQVRGPSMAASAKRAGIFWLLLVFYAAATIVIARPTEGKQITMFVILFIMIGQMAMGLLMSFYSVWWTLPITALALIGYFLLPGYFYLWMGVLGGGGMIVLGLYIHSRW